LLPAARALPAANAALTALAIPSTPILQNQIRPFVIASRPLVRNLEPAAVNLAKSTPNLAKSFGTVNQLLNMLGYNPGGAQHGYLYWLAWLDHNARTLFSQQDANGVFRPLFTEASCRSFTALNKGIAGSGIVLNFLTPILANPTICPPGSTSAKAAAVGSASKTSSAGDATSSAPTSTTLAPSTATTTTSTSTSTRGRAASGASGSSTATKNGSSTATTIQTTTTH
ncbi:MAG: hypothetical protein ACXVR1_17950, partial [Solirubrobacteraceae bacterium]